MEYGVTIHNFSGTTSLNHHRPGKATSEYSVQQYSQVISEAWLSESPFEEYESSPLSCRQHSTRQDSKSQPFVTLKQPMQQKNWQDVQSCGSPSGSFSVAGFSRFLFFNKLSTSNRSSLVLIRFVLPTAMVSLWLLLTILVSSPCVVYSNQQTAPQGNIQEDDGQVSIQRPDTDPMRAAVPLVAMSFTGDPGPKACRGSLMSALNLPRPVSPAVNNSCYDLSTLARCGVFIGVETDICEARLYAARGCGEKLKGSYMNTVAFMPEYRAVGGNYRSMLIRCGMDIDVPQAEFVEEAKSMIS